MIYRLVCLALIALTGCSTPVTKNPHVEIKTSLGDIELELFPEAAPVTVAAFLSYIDSGYYRSANFYRVLNLYNQPSNALKAELIQGGTFRSKTKKAIDPPGIDHETTSRTGLKHRDGTISLARLAPGTASTEFFICIGDQPGFDYGGENNPDGQGYAAFGKVVHGFDVVQKIYNQPEDNQYFDPLVPIINIVRL